MVDGECLRADNSVVEAGNICVVKADGRCFAVVVIERYNAAVLLELVFAFEILGF